MTDAAVATGLYGLAAAGSLAAAGVLLVPRMRSRALWCLCAAALGLLVAPWTVRQPRPGGALGWSEALGYCVAFAIAWAAGRRATWRLTLGLLAATAATASLLGLWASNAASGPAIALWPLTVQIPVAGCAGIALGAAMTNGRGPARESGSGPGAAAAAVGTHGRSEAFQATRLALALESAALFAFLVVRQAHLGVVWTWDALSLWALVGWLASLVACQAAVVWRLGGRWLRVILVGLGLLGLAQATLTAGLMQWLGFAGASLLG